MCGLLECLVTLRQAVLTSEIATVGNRHADVLNGSTEGINELWGHNTQTGNTTPRFLGFAQAKQKTAKTAVLCASSEPVTIATIYGGNAGEGALDSRYAQGGLGDVVAACGLGHK